MSFFSLTFLTRGGPVLWLLALVGVVALGIFAERALFLHRRQIRVGQFLEGIKTLLAKGRRMEALTVCEETPGPVAAVTKAALRHVADDEQGLRLALSEAALAELPALERRVGALAAVAQITPLLGLLGTLLGMARTFWLFEQAGNYATPAALSAGMWEALLTAGAGLMVAIPAHVGRYFLQSRVRSLAHDMEWAANEMLRYLLREKPAVGVPPEEESKLPRNRSA